jgi:hypothetical protein
VAGHHQRDLGRAIGQPLKKKKRKQTVLYCLQYCSFVGKDIVFGFIIEYSSLRDFGPKVIIIGLVLSEDF